MDSKSVLIVGCGFVGMTTALALAKAGKKITIVEKESSAGGLAHGFRSKHWEWALESHYHHIFTSDKEIIDLANSVGCKVNFKEAVTSVWNGTSFERFDGLIQILLYKDLSITSRMRLIIGMGLLKVMPLGNLARALDLEIIN